MLVVPEHQYPLICLAVSKGSEPDQVVTFGTINPNLTNPTFTESGECCSGEVVVQLWVIMEISFQMIKKFCIVDIRYSMFCLFVFLGYIQ